MLDRNQQSICHVHSPLVTSGHPDPEPLIHKRNFLRRSRRTAAAALAGAIVLVRSRPPVRRELNVTGDAGRHPGVAVGKSGGAAVLAVV
jgi:hypothetical protein